MLKLTKGRLLSIFIADICGPDPPPAGGHGEINPMRQVEEIEVVSNKGIVGDRWFGVKEFRLKNGELRPFSHPRQISLISLDSINEIKESIDIEAIHLRRNLLIEGISLEDKVGKIIRIGEVILKGSGLCRSCKHIEDVTQPGVKDALFRIGGLRAEVIKGGTLKAGDIIC